MIKWKIQWRTVGQVLALREMERRIFTIRLLDVGPGVPLPKVGTRMRPVPQWGMFRVYAVLRVGKRMWVWAREEPKQ